MYTISENADRFMLEFRWWEFVKDEDANRITFDINSVKIYSRVRRYAGKCYRLREAICHNLEESV